MWKASSELGFSIPHAIEQMLLRGRRCVDGVGRPKFDFHTGWCYCTSSLKTYEKVESATCLSRGGPIVRHAGIAGCLGPRCGADVNQRAHASMARAALLFGLLLWPAAVFCALHVLARSEIAQQAHKCVFYTPDNRQG